MILLDNHIPTVSQLKQHKHKVAITFWLSGQFLIKAGIINSPRGPVILLPKPQVTEKRCRFKETVFHCK